MILKLLILLTFIINTHAIATYDIVHVKLPKCDSQREACTEIQTTKDYFNTTRSRVIGDFCNGETSHINIYNDSLCVNLVATKVLPTLNPYAILLKLQVDFKTPKLIFFIEIEILETMYY
jgi:hypothetical protein